MADKVKDVVISFWDDGEYKPYLCALGGNFTHSTSLIETSVTGSGTFATYAGEQDTWALDCDGLVAFPEVGKISLQELRAKQYGHEEILVQFQRTSIAGQTYTTVGYVLITESRDGISFGGMNTFSLTMKGSGPYTVSEESS